MISGNSVTPELVDVQCTKFIMSKALSLLTTQNICPCENWIEAKALPFNAFESSYLPWQVCRSSQPPLGRAPSSSPVLDPILRTTTKQLISKRFALSKSSTGMTYSKKRKEKRADYTK